MGILDSIGKALKGNTTTFYSKKTPPTKVLPAGSGEPDNKTTDSGTFGSMAEMNAMRNSSKFRRTSNGVMRSMPKVPPVQADIYQSGGIDNAGEISQGLFKGKKITIKK